jgi:hypothetical protein
VKYYSITDAYGLGLIARGLVANSPKQDWNRIKEHLSEDARKIADEMTSPGGASREIQSAKGLLEQAQKVRNNDAL